MKIWLFARLRDAVQQDIIELSLPSDANIGEIRQALQAEYPEQAGLFVKEYALVAINQALVTDESQIPSDDDEVAFLPPMTGG